jgi:hypothetical protein
MRKRSVSKWRDPSRLHFFQCYYTEKRSQPWKNLQLFVNQYLCEFIIWIFDVLVQLVYYRIS